MTPRLQVDDATIGDLERIVELAAAKRKEYERYSPVFWHPSADATEKHRPFIRSAIESEEKISLVARRDDNVVGFVIAALVGAPPVYDPGGQTCYIDDFTVESEEDWADAGRALLDEAVQRATERGAAQTGVNCAFDDVAKRTMLTGAGYSIGNAVHVKPVHPG